MVLLGPRQGALKEKLPDRRQADRSFQADQDETGPGRTRPALAPGLVSGHGDARVPATCLQSARSSAGYSCWAATDGPPERSPAEARAVAFLSREVPALVAGEPLLFMPQQRRCGPGPLRGVASGHPCSTSVARGNDPLADPAGGLGP